MLMLREFLRTLLQVLQQMVRRWHIVGASMAACVTLVILFAFSRSPQYQTAMVVAPAASNSSNMSSALGSVGGGLLGGLIGGVGQTSQFDHYVLLLQSQSISAELMKNQRIMSLLFNKATDTRTGTFKVSLKRRIKAGLYAIFGLALPGKPTMEDVRLQLNNVLVVDEDPLDKTKATVTCTMAYPDSCRELLLTLHKLAQDRLDKIALDNARHTIATGKDLLAGVSELSLHQALATLMDSAQIQMAMTDIGQNRTVILDAPFAAQMPSFPKPILLISLALFAGLLLGGLIAWLLPATAAPRPRFTTQERSPGRDASR
jgi:hypothetical protein